MDEAIGHLHDVFSAFGPIRARRMFGGYGIYRDGLMFGLVADGVLYLKVDDDNRARFVEHGLEAFTYDKGGRPVAMSYHRAPEEIMDDPDVAADWARSAWEAAARVKRVAPGRRR